MSNQDEFRLQGETREDTDLVEVPKGYKATGLREIEEGPTGANALRSAFWISVAVALIVTIIAILL